MQHHDIIYDIEIFDIKYQGDIFKVNIQKIDDDCWCSWIIYPGNLIGSESFNVDKQESIEKSLKEICDNNESDLIILRREIRLDDILNN
jgi:hypothetical protein